MNGVNPHAPLVVITKTAANIHCAAHLGRRRVIDRYAVNCGIRGAFWFNVDVPAHAGAARRYAVEEGAGAFEQFHAIGKFHGQDLAWQNAVQAAVRNIIAGEFKTTDDKRF